MNELLFVAADPRELRDWVARWEKSHSVALPVHWARGGKFRGREVLAIANGAGSERARAAVAAAPGPALVCSVGYCGALDDSLSVGQVFLATEVRSGTRTYAVRQPRCLSAAGPSAKFGRLASIPRIARTAVEKKKLRSEGALAVEMEAAGAAAASEEINVPFYCIRAVSDLANEDFANDFDKSLMPDGRFSAARLILGAFANPVERFGELIRLSRRTALASKNLGEFLAHCNF
jgi:uridine phosphorylase